MTIEVLKNQIETNSVTDSVLIFKDSEDNFVSNQYIQAIARSKNLKINYIEDLSDVIQDTSSIFIDATAISEPVLSVLKSDIYLWGDRFPPSLKNVIIVVSKFSDKAVEKALQEYIVQIPKLEDWMIKDYVYSTTRGIEHDHLDTMIQLCGKNYHRLQNELDKLYLFNETERKYVFDAMLHDGALDDLSSYNIFNFTNALVSRDYAQLKSIIKELERVDVNEFGLLTILIKNFHNLIMVQTNSNPTPESTGMDSKTLYAVKRLPRCFNSDQLVRIYLSLLDMDRQVKFGELPTEMMIDYIVIKILSA